MKKQHSRGRGHDTLRGIRSRRPQFEFLEERLALSVTFPTITGVTSSAITLPAGAPLLLPLNATDSSTGATITYTATVTNDTTGKVTATVLSGNPVIDISVQGYGDIGIQLLQNFSPNTVARIEQLIEADFYNQGTDGLPMTFHRVIPGFMIQGGDPTGTGTGGSGVQFNDEFNPALKQTTPGLLCMANSGGDTNDSQFFITTDPSAGGTLYGDGDSQYTIFGKVIEGQSIVDAISQVATDSNNDPTTPVVISSISVVQDTLDGVMELAVPAGNTSGSATVTVTASDGTSSASQSFTANMGTYGWDNPTSYLSPIDQPSTYNGASVNNQIYTTVNQPVSFNLVGNNINNIAGQTPTVTFQYEGTSGSFSGTTPFAAENTVANLAVTVDPNTGAVTVTPSNGIVGVYAVTFGVETQPTPAWIASSNGATNPWYTLTVPIFIAPTAPTGISLASGTSTTTDNNTSTATRLSFTVTGLVVGSTVTLMEDGKTPISAATNVTASTMTIESDGLTGILNGSHTITAVAGVAYAAQTLVDRDVAAGSLTATSTASVAINVQASPPFAYKTPVFNSSPVLQAFVNAAYNYTATVVNVPGQTVTYSLPQSIDATDGLTIDSTTGAITWTPSGTLLNTVQPTVAVDIRATNPAGVYADQTFTVNVYIAAPKLDLTGDTTANSFTVRRVGQEFEILSLDTSTNANSVILEQPLSATTSFEIDGDTTTFVVDFASGGSFTLSGGLIFTNAGSGDKLIVKGTTSNTVTVSSTSVNADGMPIALTGIPLVQITGGSSTNVYKFSGSSSNVQLVNPSGSSNTLDFSATTGGTGITLDLSKKSGQAQAMAAWGGDTLALTGLVTYLDGTPYNDVLTGNGVNSVIHGEGGNDTLNAGAGGTALLYGDSGNNKLYADTATAVLYGGTGNNMLYGGTQKSVLIGGSGTNTLTAGSGQTALVAGTPSAAYATDQALMGLLTTWRAPTGLAYLGRLSPVLAKLFGGTFGLKMGTSVTPSVGHTTIVSSGWMNTVIK